MKNNLSHAGYERILNKQCKLRDILAKYGEEYGDAIVDEICNLFDYPDTIDLDGEEAEE